MNKGQPFMVLKGESFPRLLTDVFLMVKGRIALTPKVSSFHFELSARRDRSQRPVQLQATVTQRLGCHRISEESSDGSRLRRP
jgi:hypothetical protein